MKRKQHWMVVEVIFSIFMATLQGSAQAGGSESTPWQAVDKAMGRSGQVQADKAYKYGLPRGDMKVVVAGVEVKPTLALGSWVAFSKPDADAMMMGDLVLADDEVAPVMAALEAGGVQVTAVHNHVLHESPRVMYMHIGGHGDAVQLATTVKKALDLTKTPAPNPTAAAPQDIGIDTAAIE